MEKVAVEERNFMPGDAMWKSAQSNEPMIQMRRAFAEFNTILIDIGTVALPPVIAGLKSVHYVLKGIEATTSFVAFLADKTIGTSPQSKALMKRGIFRHLSDAWSHLWTTPP